MNPKNRNNMTDKDWEALQHSLSLPSQKEGWNQLLPALEQQLPLQSTPDKKRRKRYLWVWWMIIPMIAIILYYTGFHSKNNSDWIAGRSNNSLQNTDSKNTDPGNRDPKNTDISNTDLRNTDKEKNDSGSAAISTEDSLNHHSLNKENLEIEHYITKDEKSTTAPGKKSNVLIAAKKNQSGTIQQHKTSGLFIAKHQSAKKPGLSNSSSERSARKTRNKNSNKAASSNNPIIPKQAMQVNPELVKNETGQVNNQPEQAVTAQRKDSSTTIQKTGSAKVDSVGKETPVTSIDTKELIISAGLQWNFQVPASDPSPYFTGPNLTFQPYRNLVPGAWIRVQVERSAIIADVTPFYSTLVSPRTHYTFHQSTRVGDTIINTTEERSMRKNFGIGAGIGYEYRLLPQWWIGVGFHSYWWNKAIGQAAGKEEKIPVGGTDKVSRNYNRDYIIPSEENSYFRKSQQNLSFTALYTKNKWQAGMRAGFTFSSLAKRDGPRNLTRFDFLFRLPLIGARKKF